MGYGKLEFLQTHELQKFPHIAAETQDENSCDSGSLDFDRTGIRRRGNHLFLLPEQYFGYSYRHYTQPLKIDPNYSLALKTGSTLPL